MNNEEAVKTLTDVILKTAESLGWKIENLKVTQPAVKIQGGNWQGSSPNGLKVCKAWSKRGLADQICRIILREGLRSQNSLKDQ